MRRIEARAGLLLYSKLTSQLHNVIFKFLHIRFTSIRPSESLSDSSNAHIAVYPPSTGKFTPVIQPASSDARKTTLLATSSTTPIPPRGCARSVSFLASGSPCKFCVIVVWRNPGQIALLVMRYYRLSIDEHASFANLPPYLLLSIVQRHLLTQHTHGTFRGTIRRSVEVCHERLHGRSVDDTPSISRAGQRVLRQHLRDRILAAEEHRFRVDR